MKYQNIVTNPIFKIVGIIAILYFALFHNKYDSRSLNKRYSKENLKQNVLDASKKRKEIQQKIHDAKERKTKTAINKLKQDNEQE